jgi:hypothetical protein
MSDLVQPVTLKSIKQSWFYLEWMLSSLWRITCVKPRFLSQLMVKCHVSFLFRPITFVTPSGLYFINLRKVPDLATIHIWFSVECRYKRRVRALFVANARFHCAVYGWNYEVTYLFVLFFEAFLLGNDNMLDNQIYSVWKRCYRQKKNKYAAVFWRL